MLTVDVPQCNLDPGISHVVLVLIIVIPFVIDLDPEAEALALQRILVVERLNNFQRACPIVVPNHCKLISPVSTVLKNLRQGHMMQIVLSLGARNRVVLRRSQIHACAYLVVELVRLILIVDSDREDRRVRERCSIRLVYFRKPFVLRKMGRHVVYVFDSYRRRPSA